MDAEKWAYRDRPGAYLIVPLAAVAEMADRVYVNNWETNLD